MVYVLLFVLSTVFGVMNGVSAETYWVGPSGSNGNTCGQAQSSSTPRQTISAGVECLGAGDTLMVKSGTYNEGVNFRSGSGEGGRIMYQAENPRGVIIHPGDNYTIEANWITIEGFVFDGNDVTIGNNASNGQHVRIQNGEFRNAPTSCIFGLNGVPQYLELL